MDQNPKQQVAEKLRSSANVLITVSKNPSVDQLAAAIGLSLMMNSLGKHVATVFSGQIPDIISFLEPENTFEDSVDGLRDFIISLDKEKADKLRYKVEDEVVKIFITPYRSKITEDDLNFEQGDFNVDVVVALGVKKKADLDEAITAHGRILHDATVIAVNASEVGGDVGSISWADDQASSLCEMLVSISEALEGGILDAPMSTAFLTGIVSVTERFSNEKTTPKLMTMSAQLMAAGANQQLISEKLNMNKAGKSDEKLDKSGEKDGLMIDLTHDEKSESKKKDKQPKEDRPNKQNEKKQDQKKDSQDDKPKKEDITLEDASKEFKLDELEKQLQEKEDDKPKEELKLPDPELDFEDIAPTPVVDNKLDIDESTGELRSIKSDKHIGDKLEDENPSMGGTFNATSRDANIEKRMERVDQQNNALLSHKPKVVPNEQSGQDMNGAQPAIEGQEVNLDDGLDDARKAVEQAMSQTPFDPANNPVQSIGAQPLSEVETPHVEPPMPQQVSQPPMPDVSMQQPAPQPPVQMPQQPMNQPPASPPPLPPPMPPQAQAQPQSFQPQGPTPNPAFNPVMNTSNPAQTFNLPGQQPQAQPQMDQMPPQQPLPPNAYQQQRMDQAQAVPPPPNGNFPPPPQ